MNLFFKENIKLSKLLFKLDIAVTVVYAAVAFKTRTPLQALSTTGIIFAFLIAITNSLLNYRDNHKLSYLLNNLYGNCNPTFFLEEIEKAIDYSIINNKVKTLVLSHKANALCYQGNFKDAYKVLDEISTITTSEDDKFMLLSNKISYKILEEDFENINEDIKSLQKYINLSGGKSKKKSFLSNESVNQKELQLKIAKSEKLNSSEVNTLWELTNHGGNNLNLESLRYYSAIFLIGEKDIAGAAEQLNKIPYSLENNIIEVKAHKLYKSIESQIPVEPELED
jgi:hypothetical protein